jgi:hypothetical protein
MAAQRWGRAVDVAERLAAREPRNASLVLGLAAAVNDLAWGGAPYGRERQAMRTSLRRIELEQRALALTDSAAALATNAADWCQARQMRGSILENLGLPLDALVIYVDEQRRAPGFAPARARADRVSRHLADPTTSTDQQ